MCTICRGVWNLPHKFHLYFILVNFFSLNAELFSNNDTQSSYSPKFGPLLKLVTKHMCKVFLVLELWCNTYDNSFILVKSLGLHPWAYIKLLQMLDIQCLNKISKLFPDLWKAILCIIKTIMQKILLEIGDWTCPLFGSL